MDDKKFEKIDKELMHRFATDRQKGTPEELFKGFSASVEAKIQERQQRRFKPFAAPMLVPAFVVIFLASWVVLKQPTFQTPTARPYMGMLLTSASDVTEEIAALQELGAWGDADREALGVSDLEVLPE